MLFAVLDFFINFSVKTCLMKQDCLKVVEFKLRGRCYVRYDSGSPANDHLKIIDLFDYVTGPDLKGTHM